MGSFDQFVREFRKSWPIVATLSALAFTAVVFGAKADAKLVDHESRIKTLELTSPDVARAITTLSVQQVNTQRSVDRLETKIDTLTDRSR